MSGINGFRPKARAGLTGVKQCEGCSLSHLFSGSWQDCPQLTLLKDTFMNTWVVSPYALRHQPLPDVRRTLGWMEANYDRIRAWAKRLGCEGRDRFEEARLEYLRSLPKERA